MVSEELRVDEFRRERLNVAGATRMSRRQPLSLVDVASGESGVVGGVRAEGGA